MADGVGGGAAANRVQSGGPRALGARGLLLAAPAAFIAFALDQVTKWAALEFDPLTGFEPAVSFLGVRLTFVYGINPGVNFGLFAGGGPAHQWALAGLALAVSVGLLVWAWRTSRPIIAVACGMVIGGALGNAIDRINPEFGGVFDFINIDCCGIGNPFAFNIADVAIFLGAALIAIYVGGDEPVKSDAPAADEEIGPRP